MANREAKQPVWQEWLELGDEMAATLAHEGLRCGEATVVSRHLHQGSRKYPGLIRILVDRDAGMTLAHLDRPRLVVHADLYHAPAAIDDQSLADNLRSTLEFYCRIKGWSLDQAQALAGRIFLRTTGAGSWLSNPLPSNDSGRQPFSRTANHIHLLFREFSGEELASLPFLIDALERELLRQGIELRKVERIMHVERREEGVSIMGFNPNDHWYWRLASYLSSLLGSPEELQSFLQAFLPGFFRRKEPIDNLRSKHGNLRTLIGDLTEAGLLNHGIFHDTLTKQGEELLNFVIKHSRELESDLRKALRRIPVHHGHYRALRRSVQKSKQKYYSYASKTACAPPDNWLGAIAVPETMVQAAKKRLERHSDLVQVEREDFQVYQKRINQPVDICLIIDGSASMAGPKMKAVWILAEHLLLTTRDKVAVIVFQEHRGKMVVPFTRNYTRLQEGLRGIRPRGMTPMAEGLKLSLETIKNHHIHNPLLILITDGIPTSGQSTHPDLDALQVAEEVAKSRARMICIGVQSNWKFMRQLADRSGASLYIVDKLDDESALIRIVAGERKISTRS